MKIFIHYLKTRALMQISQWLAIAIFSITILGVFAVADAYGAFGIAPQGNGLNSLHISTQLPLSAYRCADLQGSTSGGCSLDEGCMNFDNEPPSKSLASEICGPSIAIVNGNPQNFELHGWVWDTNLGYISLRCDSNGRNNDVDCGSIPYGVKIDVQSGKMSGWAWSDNIGWISFGCENGLNDGHACGNIDYNVEMNMEIGKDLGTMGGYAWADSVGWFNFQSENVHAKILDLMLRTSSDETNWGVWTKGEIGGTSLTDAQKNGIPLKGIMPIASEGNGYDLFVYVADIVGNPIILSGDIDVDIKTQWKDTVGWDQTDLLAEDYSDRNQPNFVMNGETPTAGIPASKPNVGFEGPALTFGSGPATTGGINNTYYGLVTSTMPTDGGNCYDGDGDGSCYTGEENFFYKNFAGSGAPENTLVYNSSTVTVTIRATGETWTGVVKPLGYNTGRRMDFLPQVDIPKLDYLMTPGDSSSGVPLIQAIRNKVDEFKIKVKQNITNASFGVLPIRLVLDSGVPDAKYVFFDSGSPSSGEGTPSAWEVDPSSLSSQRIISDTGGVDRSMSAMPYSPDEDAVQEFLTGASLHSIVSIPQGVRPVSLYFSNGLPRIFDSNIQTQAAEIISGNVFSPGAKDVVQGSDVPLFGDTAVYELRTQILEDVSSLIRGVSLQTVGSSPVTINSSANLSKNKFKNGQLYYFENQDVTIDDINTLANSAPGKPITIVLKGGDLYIHDNIDTGQPFGFIVFESDTDSNQATKGGRIYIHSSITDMVDVHIFSDGPIFRYADGVCYYWGNYGPLSGLVGLREPNFVGYGARCSGGSGSFKEPVSALSNQFYLKGNIASFNCLGCSTDIKPSRGDGLDLGGANALNFAIARLYDFNYFSYFRVHPITGVDSGSRSTNVSANAHITNKDKSVYFEYSPAPSDLLGFRNF